MTIGFTPPRPPQGREPGLDMGAIEMPAAKRTLLVGLNQCILLSLSRVVLAGLVGAGGSAPR